MPLPALASPEMGLLAGLVTAGAGFWPIALGLMAIAALPAATCGAIGAGLAARRAGRRKI